MLTCPVCRKPLLSDAGSFSCENGHRFDIAREGYVNLLRTNKAGDRIGDDKLSARSRRDFLNRGYYAPLKDALCRIFQAKTGSVLDICCGEGYYTAALAQNPNLSVYGFDISKEMVRLASKRGRGTYFVANMAEIPVPDGCFDYAVHLFAPFKASEFSRILKPDGELYTVIPGERHLFGLKSALYDTPYPNDEQLPAAPGFILLDTQKVTACICLANQSDIEAVFRMTPYYFHTSETDRQKLAALETLETEIEFVIAHYQKTDV